MCIGSYGQLHFFQVHLKSRGCGNDSLYCSVCVNKLTQTAGAMRWKCVKVADPNADFLDKFDRKRVHLNRAVKESPKSKVSSEQPKL